MNEIDRSNKGRRWKTLCMCPLIKRTKNIYKHTHIWGLTINAYMKLSPLCVQILGFIKRIMKGYM